MKYDNMPDLRKELNQIDSSLLSLFKERFDLIHEASIIKKIQMKLEITRELRKSSLVLGRNLKTWV